MKNYLDLAWQLIQIFFQSFSIDISSEGTQPSFSQTHQAKDIFLIYKTIGLKSLKCTQYEAVCFWDK